MSPHAGTEPKFADTRTAKYTRLGGIRPFPALLKTWKSTQRKQVGEVSLACAACSERTFLNMSETSASLLDRLQRNPDAAAWQRLVDLYTPLVRGWLRGRLHLPQDADDVIQEVFAVVVRKLPAFQRAPHPGAFRGWLRAITVNCLRDFWRGNRLRPAATGNSDFLQLLDQLEDPQSALSREWDREHDRHVAGRLLELLEPDFEDRTWQAFRRVVLQQQPPEQVARDLGMTVNAVYVAKSKVLARFRQEGQGLID